MNFLPSFYCLGEYLHQDDVIRVSKFEGFVDSTFHGVSKFYMRFFGVVRREDWLDFVSRDYIERYFCFNE